MIQALTAPHSHRRPQGAIRHVGSTVLTCTLDYIVIVKGLIITIRTPHAMEALWSPSRSNYICASLIPYESLQLNSQWSHMYHLRPDSLCDVSR